MLNLRTLSFWEETCAGIILILIAVSNIISDSHSVLAIVLLVLCLAFMLAKFFTLRKAKREKDDELSKEHKEMADNLVLHIMIVGTILLAAYMMIFHVSFTIRSYHLFIPVGIISILRSVIFIILDKPSEGYDE